MNIHWKYTLTVNGAAPSGLTNPSGVPLDGAGDGQVGSNYVASVTWRNLAGTASKLPTYALVHKTPPQPAHKKVSPRHVKAAVTQRVKVALHPAAVDHLLATRSLQVSKNAMLRR
jgi:hypothetical protein